MNPSAPLPNPERAWSAREPRVDREELERCLGAPLAEPFEVLGGGLANLNVRSGEHVIRLYRRDRTVARREAALLRRAWQSFRVPRVLREGADFWASRRSCLSSACSLART